MYSLENSVILHEGAKSKHKVSVIVQLLIFIAVMLVANIATGIIVGLPTGIMMAGTMMEMVDPNELLNGTVDINALSKQLMDSLPEWYGVVSLFSTVLTTLAVLLYCRKLEGRSSASMGLRKAGFLANYGKGYLIGIVMMLAAAGLSVLFGATDFAGLNQSVSWLYIGLFFLGYLVQGMSEEFLCRGYLAVSLANKTKVAVAVGISSVVFAMLHLANSGLTVLAFINLALFGVFMGVYMFRTDDLWGACAIHSAWNFVQGNVLGVSVSGGKLQSSVFGTTFVKGRELLNGGSFGLEGGLCVTIVLLAGILLTLYLPMKPRPELPEEPEAEPAAENEPIPLYINK